MAGMSEWFTDGTPEDLEARARHMAIVSPLSYEQARKAILDFTAAMQSVMRAFNGSALAFENIRRSVGYETPRHSALHAAYHAKTRRRNRRRASR